MLRTFEQSSAVLRQLDDRQGNVSAETMATARTWLDMLGEVVMVNQLAWLDPLVNLSPNTEIVLEWWHTSKKLTIYIDGDRAEYVQVWGADIDREMADGDANQAAAVETLWRWLLG
jgi:hypothetical protein